MSADPTTKDGDITSWLQLISGHSFLEAKLLLCKTPKEVFLLSLHNTLSPNEHLKIFIKMLGLTPEEDLDTFLGTHIDIFIRVMNYANDILELSQLFQYAKHNKRCLVYFQIEMERFRIL